MSLLVNHGLFGGYLRPQSINTNAAGLASGTYTITPSVAPTEGNLLLFLMGGSQTRSLSSSPAGVTELSFSITGSGAGTNRAFYKIATGSEPASYDFVWGASLSGGWRYREIINFDPVDTFEILNGTGALAATSVTPDASYDVLVPSFAITTLNLTVVGDWAVDNGYTDALESTAFQTAVKAYPLPLTNETVNWTGVSSDLITLLITINGKKI